MPAHLLTQNKLKPVMSLALTCLFLLAQPAVAAIYKCEVEGRASFSDLPCEGPQSEFVGLWLTHSEREALRVEKELKAIREEQIAQQQQSHQKAKATSPSTPQR